LPKALRRPQTCAIHSSSWISRRSKPGQCDSETLCELSSNFPLSRRGKHHLDARRNHRGEKAHVMPPNMIANCRGVLTSIASSAACSHYGSTDQLVANTLERVQLRPVPHEASMQAQRLLWSSERARHAEDFRCGSNWETLSTSRCLPLFSQERTLVCAPKYCADQLLWNLLGESPPKQPLVGAPCGMVTAAPPRS
jgi:hypothetical protein